MIEIVKNISFEEVLEKIEEAKNIGILALVFAIVSILILALCFWYFFQCDDYTNKRIATLEDLLEQEVEKNRALEYKVRFYCDTAVYIDENGNKKSIKKK